MRRATYLLAVMATAFLTACGGSDNDDLPVTTTTAAATTIDKVAQDRGFGALLAAATKAELGSALSDANAQLTVLAPTDAAFNNLATALGFANATAMVNALPAATLKNILSYHVLPGNKPAAQLTAAAQSNQATLYSFEGQPASVAVNTAGGVKVGDAVLTNANVVATDVAASNGVIHAIDKVLVPPGVLNIVQMAQLNPELSSLVGAVTRANLQGTLSGAGPFTVFAPTNAAFAAAPSGLSTQQLSTVLTYHVLGTQVLASQIPFGTPIGTAANQAITFNAGTPPTITDTTSTPARITATNVRASNGVIHLIDKVLIPAL
ncbi:fasciclin domain-containing protein [Noviherbaspirillum aerium]|uniref:fasciclin domain-containing protein n=1 Tax=Noviherbaspirillum aerium TaxID=2588497 RepID=UPI00124CB3EA|nr:fasciclin domain-containing protein [Noviherbaspirillum aerium]